jgi:hypothetical protein
LSRRGPLCEVRDEERRDDAGSREPPVRGRERQAEVERGRGDRRVAEARQAATCHELPGGARDLDTRRNDADSQATQEGVEERDRGRAAALRTDEELGCADRAHQAGKLGPCRRARIRPRKLDGDGDHPLLRGRR